MPPREFADSHVISPWKKMHILFPLDRILQFQGFQAFPGASLQLRGISNMCAREPEP